MGNQVSVGNQDTQQIGQDQTNHLAKTLEKSKINHPVIIVSILISFVIIAFGAYYISKGNNQANPTSVTREVNLTDSWKTYKSKDITFKFPQNWIEKPIVIGGSRSIQEFENPEKKFTLTLVDAGNYNQITGKPYATIDEFINMPYKVKTVIIDGQDGRQPLPRAGSENINSIDVFSKDEKAIYTLELQTGTTSLNTPESEIEEGQKLFNLILSTFKFIDQNSIVANTPFLQLLDANKSEIVNKQEIAYMVILGGRGGCQPDFFDPQTSKYRETTHEDAINSENSWANKIYVVEPVNKVGNYNFSFETLETDKGYDINIYKFGCASSWDYVLDVNKDNKRVALYTHVDTFNVADQGNFLFLSNYIQNSDGKFDRKRRIISFDGSKKITLPQLNCVSRFAEWSGGNLITYAVQNVDMSDLQGEALQNYQTKICVWNTNGDLLYKLQGKLTWYGANSNYLWGSIGLLPKDPNIFYAYDQNFSVTPHTCSLFLQDLSSQTRYKTIDLFPESGDMPQHLCPDKSSVEFDFNNSTYDKTTFRYRLKKGNFLSTEGVYEKLTNWQTVTR